MIQRTALPFLTQLLHETSALALLGPRQVGKTTLARDLADSQPTGRPALYLDLESEADRAKLAEPELYLRQHADKLVVLDEIHHVPELFKVLRGLIDAGRRAGRRDAQFIVLGSASIELLRQSAETLAGRIAYVELAPLMLAETGADSANALWLRGGFPDSYLARSDAASLRWRRDFIRTYLQRDVPMFGPAIAAETLRRFWTMLAHNHGALLNQASIARALGVDNKTVTNYLDLMVDLLLVRRLQPWHVNTGKRLVKSPKVYVRDTGLMHALLQIDTADALLGHPKAGDSWEGFVIENILAALPAPADAECGFYRTSAGAEIDLVLRHQGQLWAIEIKRSLSPTLTRGFYSACEDLKPDHKCVIYPGQETFPMGDGITVMGLAEAVATIGG